MINFKGGFVLCHVKCAGMKTFGDQLQFLTGKAAIDSTISNWTPFNCFGLLAKIDSLPSAKSIRKYLECIAMTKCSFTKQLNDLIKISSNEEDKKALKELMKSKTCGGPSAETVCCDITQGGKSRNIALLR